MKELAIFKKYKYNYLQVKWTVAPWNEVGKHFYTKLGTKQNNE